MGGAETGLSALPVPLRAVVGDALAQLPAAPAAVAALLPRLLAASRFARERLLRDPSLVLRLDLPIGPDALEARVRAEVTAAADVAVALRQARSRELVRIAFAEIAGTPLGDTLAALTRLAETCTQLAYAQAWSDGVQRHGVPRDESGQAVTGYVLGMGKLGGGELNFSSDIDLILGFTGSGETDGPRGISNDEFFEKLARQLTRLLAERTAEGFVYRVDWLLRPFGASGPPAMSSTAMETYYQSHGREWERYAFIKARAVAGDLAAGAALLRALEPFVYRRYLDYNAVGALRGLKRTIEQEVARRELQDNVKLGAGGIREVEFVVQLFQLMRAGPEPALRGQSLRPVLRALGEAGHLPAQTARALDADYAFLRRLENCIQLYDDQQSHELPGEGEARDALLAAMGFPSWAALSSEVAAVRSRVSAEFERVFAAPEPAPGGAAAGLIADLAGGAEVGGALAALGFVRETAALAQALAALRVSPRVRALSEASAHRLDELLALLVQEAAAVPEPDVALVRVLQVLDAIGGRSTYLTLLRESPDARAQLLRLCAASPWITDLIARSPILLDQLLDERSLYAPPERVEIAALLEDAFAAVSGDDTEGAMNVLRNFRQETMLRIAAADLVRALPLVKVSDRLTWLAEALLEKTLALTRDEMSRQFGAPHRADGRLAGFAVAAYGKFGGVEMGYGSDLDIVFLHDCDALQGDTAGGARSVPNEVWLARLAQRIIHWLSTQTAAGRVYEVDLELRPDGRRGLTVSSVSAFEEYQRQQAWTWEHQALSRARAVAGDARVRDAFARVRREVLTAPRDAARLQSDVASMRRRMRTSLDKSREGRFDVKQGQGGLTDIEFITQYLVLRHAPQHPALVEWPDHWRQTEALVAAGVLPAAEAQALIAVYRAYRGWLHARDLQRQDHLAEDARFLEERRAVGESWRRHLGDGA
ncbi:MAG TPA: bifunctional [glutamate--ammonia ligase]-adenylyl-L-tyrosine phosphorylase/[glutamate--ammonia-ligase] adenylyltransferase [Candidatus Binatia bacterium]|nr:bifunctional [glutamate--ammonia ligase]-adenylyl-L-tyrosine phosphorylase/[glutamate--ammonia-ligase] adenylyltransferase [Candidatus Binatia bacterium]